MRIEATSHTINWWAQSLMNKILVALFEEPLKLNAHDSPRLSIITSVNVFTLIYNSHRNWFFYEFSSCKCKKTFMVNKGSHKPSSRDMVEVAAYRSTTDSAFGKSSFFNIRDPERRPWESTYQPKSKNHASHEFVLQIHRIGSDRHETYQ